MDKILINEFLKLLTDMRKFSVSPKINLDIPRGELAALDTINVLNQSNTKATTSLLSEKLDISKPAVSQVINTLEKKGWVQREIDSNDKRIYCLSLTENGRNKLSDIYKKFSDSAGRVLSMLDEKDIENLIDITGKISKILEQKTDE